MRETQSKRFGELTVSVTQLPPRRATKVSNRLRRILAPALAQAARGELPTKLSDVKVDKMLDALGSLDIGDDDLDYLTDSLLATALVTTADGKSAELLPVFDAVVTGVLMHMKLLMFAAEVNFGDFMPAFRALAPPPKPMPGPSTSKE